MVEQTPETTPDHPSPVSLRADTVEASPLTPLTPPPAAHRGFLIFGTVVIVFLVAIVLIFASGSRNESLSEDEVRSIVEEVVGTQVAALPILSDGGGSSVDIGAVQQLVDQAVGTQVARLRPTNTPVPPTPTVIPRGVAEEDDTFLGPDNASVVIVEFSDFQCAFCGRWFSETLPKILEKYPDEVKFVYRDFPIFGEESLRAAMATECAEEQGRFWGMHDRLFTRLVNREDTDLSEESLISFADELGMDTRSFGECLTSQRYRDEVLLDFQAAEAYGLRGTPGFVINGVVYSIGAQPFEVFDRIIGQELARSES